MSDEILISKVELDNLNERVKKLAVEKSYLQVFIHLMNEMSTVSGLENTIQKLLQIILGNIGGSNLIIYYIIDDEIFYADVLGEKRVLEQIEDDIVKKVFETKELIEIQSDFTDTKLLGTEFTTASTWAFPLLVGNDLIGVLKIEDLYTGTTDLHFHLPTFFSYAAHILKNEILGHTKLKSAFDLLTEENNLRKQAEEKLKTINEELENRVEERTLELHHLNVQLEEELVVRRSAEAQILKLNRILSVLSEINQAIVRIHDAGKILTEACRIAVENGKFKMAWIGMVNFQTNKVEVATSYGMSGDYLESIDIDLTDELRSSGPTGIAVKTGKHKISNNINNDESMLPWRERAIKYGYKSSASFPLLVFDKVIGAFNIYSDENNFFLEDDITLLDEMAKDISFALEFIQSENDRKQTELHLINSEREYRSLAENSPDNIVRYDRKCRAIYCNTKMMQTLSVKPELMLGKTPLEFGAGGKEVDTEYELCIRRVLENGESIDLEIVMPHSGGGYNNHLIRFVAERDTEGTIVGVLAIGQDITERKRSEESLRESETKLRVMFENSRDAIGVSKKGTHVFANPAYLKLFGYERLEDLVGTSVLDCIAPSQHPQIIENLRRRDSGEDAPLFYETRGRRKDGREFDFEINVSTYRLNGEIYTLANIRDITSRKLMEKALFFVAQRSWQTGKENFFDSLAQFLGENLDMDYVVVDKIDADPDIAETIALYAKGSMVPNIRYTLKGTPCENVMGRQLCSFPKEVQKLFPEDKLLVDMGVESYIGIPLWDSLGKPIGLIALMSNKPYPEDSAAIQVLQLVATRAAAELERERSESNLKAREREYRTLAENIPNNIIRYNLDCRAVYLNHMVETIKYSKSDIIGEPPSDKQFDGAKGIAEYNEKLKWVMETGAEEEMEMVLPDLEGNIHVHEVHFVAERDTNGEITGALAIGHDITERKQAEEEIHKLNQELEQRVADRTAQLENANRELETFAYSVSHDLRAPLRGIDGFSQVLVDEYYDLLDEHGKNYLQRVRSSAQRMAQLIDDLLNLSRVSMGELNIHRVNLSKIAREIADDLFESQPERQVEFSIHDNILLQGDGRLLRIVMENLIGNSWKFTSKKPSARIEFGMKKQNDKTVYFIRDNGAGFNMDYSQKLFGAFQRLHTVTEFSGTGIGLATVQRIIHKHSGSVWAEAEVEKGATFYFTIPEGIQNEK